jgi:hypothetical protein
MLAEPIRPQPKGRETGWQGSYSDWRRRRVPAEPPTLASAAPKWKAGDTIPLGRRSVRVPGKRDDDADQPPVLVVEEA